VLDLEDDDGMDDEEEAKGSPVIVAVPRDASADLEEARSFAILDLRNRNPGKLMCYRPI
jgi:hypothetical protein